MSSAHPSRPQPQSDPAAAPDDAAAARTRHRRRAPDTTEHPAARPHLTPVAGATGVPLADAREAAERVEEFLAARDELSSLDPQEVTAVFTGGGMLVLDRADLATLTQFVHDQAEADDRRR